MQLGEWRQRQSDAPYFRWLIFSSAVAGTFIFNLDKSVTSVALPTIASFFQVPPDRLQWVVSAYLLAISGTLPAFGRLADMVGRKKIFITGLLVYILGSLLSGVASGFAALVACRVLQAVGASMFVANIMAIVSNTFPGQQRGRAFGAMSSIVAVGNIAGPAFGGWLIGSLGWRWAFLINIPFALLAVGMAWVLMPSRSRRSTYEPFDLLGAGTLFFSLVALLLFLSNGTRWGWFSLPGVFSLAAGLASFILFLWWERRAPSPLIRLEFFRLPGFAAGNVALFLCYVVLFFLSVLVPLFLAQVEGYAPARLGSVMFLWPLAMVPASTLGGWLSERQGEGRTAAIGLLFVAAGDLFLGFWRPGLETWQVILPMLLIGTGMGLFTASNQNFLMGAVPPGQAGVVNGIVAAVRNIGSVAGVALGVAIFTLLLQKQGVAPGQPGYLLAYSRSFGAVFMLGAAFSLLGCVFSFKSGQRKEKTARSGIKI